MLITLHHIQLAMPKGAEAEATAFYTGILGKAHPAFEVKGLEAVTAQLVAAGLEVIKDQDLAGIRRIYIHDPFGNRIELLEQV